MAEPILAVEDLAKWFPIKRTLGEVIRKEQLWVKGVDGITFHVKRGEIFGLVGESGCGKTTTGKLVMKLLEPTSGKIMFEGKDVTQLEPAELERYRRSVQMIFQDPYASMNPRFRARDVLEEPLIVHHMGDTRAEREEIIFRALQEVRLIPPEEFMVRFPHMLSGGQRQRVATARTLILSPTLIVADEPVSMIDLSTRAEILHMMKDVQQQLQLTYLYITHDLSTARYFTDRIAVMYLGKIVELGTSGKVVDKPLHPYTKALISAVPEPVSGRVNLIKEVPIKGEIPSGADIPPGCRFHPRCPYAMDVCKKVEPEMIEVTKGHWGACHLLT